MSGTAFFITVDWDAGDLAVSQLSFLGTSGTQTIFGPAFRPPDAGLDALASPQTVRVELPDSLSGTFVNVEVDGLYAGRVDSAGNTFEVITLGYEVDFGVTLTRVGSDGGTDGGDGG